MGSSVAGNADADNINVAGAGNVGITFRGSSSGTGNIFFADSTSGDDLKRGQIVYDHSNNSMRVHTNAVERMRIDSSGDLLVGGHTSPNNYNSGISFVQTNLSTAYQRIGHNSTGAAYAYILFGHSGNDIGGIKQNSAGTAVSYNTTSDYRLKENVVDINDGIVRVKQLQPRRFNFIADADTTVDGFIAHEAQTVVPEAITGTHNEVDDEGNPVYQGIDQSKLVPLLTAALQEAIAKIETLEAKVAALEAG